jgi:hypothetical protein
MNVTIYGKPSKCQRKIIRKAAHFYGSCLISNRLSNNVCITIKFKKNFLKREYFYGVCDALDINRPRDFDIEIDADLTFEETLSVLAHELVHVKQYVTGQLKDYSTSKKTKWKGIYNIDVSAKKIFSIKSKNDALQLAEIYLKNFLVDNTPGELKILDIWIQGFKKQLSQSC